MGLFVKICGISTIEAAITCVEAGADAIGFVFTESPRQVTVEDAVTISEMLPADVARVGVLRRPSPADVARVMEGFRPDLLQADHDTLPPDIEIGLLPVFHEGEPAAPEGGRFLYEGPASGVGRQVDLNRAAGMARLGEMVLAGGLRPDNVGRAIVTVRPFGVDVSSGVEMAPGVKSLALIRSFVAAVRAAEERLVNA